MRDDVYDSRKIHRACYLRVRHTNLKRDVYFAPSDTFNSDKQAGAAFPFSKLQKRAELRLVGYLILHESRDI